MSKHCEFFKFFLHCFIFLMFLRNVFLQFFTAKLLYRKEAGNSFNLTVMVVIGQHLLS